MPLHLLNESWIGIGIGKWGEGRCEGREGIGRGFKLAAMMPSGFATWAATAAEREWEALSGWLMLGEWEVGGGGGHAYVDCFTKYKKHCCWMLKNLEVHFGQIHDPVGTEWRHFIISIILRVAPRSQIWGISITLMDFIYTLIISVYLNAIDTKRNNKHIKKSILKKGHFFQSDLHCMLKAIPFQRFHQVFVFIKYVQWR